MAVDDIDISRDELIEGYIIANPDLWAEAHLRSPMDPQKPLMLREYQRKILQDRHNRRLMRMGRRCLAKGDLVYTTSGPMPVEILLHTKPEEHRIFTVNVDTGAVYPTSDYDIYFNGQVRTLEIVTRLGYRQRVSENHPFLVYSNTYPKGSWVNAEHIMVGNQIAVLNPYAWSRIEHDTVIDIIYHPDPVDTYDVHVPDTECFVGNGIIQHNTGKSVYLVIEALWRAFTFSNRQVLMTAAYETQIDNLFDLMRRMAFDAPDIKSSIARYRRKPYELWFKNGSVIRGLVANASIRGKCMAKGSQVWMGDGSYKPIEQIKAGEKVVCYDTETNQPTLGTVANFYENGIKDVYELRTTSARRIIATGNHPLYTFAKGGWVHLEDLKSYEKDGADADFIAVMGPSGDINWSRVQSVTYFGKLPTYDIEVEKYHHFISFYPGSIEESGFIKSGLYSGGILVHNSADDLIIDEGDYIPNDVMLADIWPIATTYAHTTVIFSSTPSGRRDFFWKVSVNRDKPEFNFHEFHIPSSMSPEWTPEQESLVRAITSQIQYVREYEADFGEAAEGVFRNKDIDASCFVYGYDDLKINRKNEYYVGVDWNETKNGVQIVVLEKINDDVKAIPYMQGAYDKRQKESISGKMRLFRVYSISALDYINTKAVDVVLDVLATIVPTYTMFDHGHGHTNWELLRLAIKNGVSPTGKKVRGLTTQLERMAVLDFGTNIETIDPVTDEKTSHLAKNFLVQSFQSLLENHGFVLPACDKKGNMVEDTDLGLVPQLRDYSISRIGVKGAVYTAGPAGDHRLDATMLAYLGMLKSGKSFLHHAPSGGNQSAYPTIQPRTLNKRITDSTQAPPSGFRYTEGGILVIDYGKWSKKGDPPETTLEQNSGQIKPRGAYRKKTRSSFMKRGERQF